MEIAGVKQWGDLAGKTVRVRHSEHRIWEIGHIIKNDWFCPERDFNPEALKNKEQDNEEKTNGY
jgi:hypothetical protein